MIQTRKQITHRPLFWVAREWTPWRKLWNAQEYRSIQFQTWYNLQSFIFASLFDLGIVHIYFDSVNGQICQGKISDAPGQLPWKACLRYCLVATQPRCFPSSALSVLCFGPWCYCWWFSTASAWLAQSLKPKIGVDESMHVQTVIHESNGGFWEMIGNDLVVSCFICIPGIHLSSLWLQKGLFQNKNGRLRIPGSVTHTTTVVTMNFEDLAKGAEPQHGWSAATKLRLRSSSRSLCLTIAGLDQIRRLSWFSGRLLPFWFSFKGPCIRKQNQGPRVKFMKFVQQVGASLQWGVLSPGAVDAPWLVQFVNAMPVIIGIY